MQETCTNVAVAGATGNLGPSVVQALVHAGFQVFALSRKGNAEGLPSSVKTVVVDYNSHNSVVNALKTNNIHAFVCNLPDHGAQPALIDAAISAGVKRFIPSEFGSNVYGNAKAAALPVFGGKVATQQYLKQKSDQISWTIIINNAFLDWGVRVGFIVNVSGTTTLYDDPASKHSMTTLEDVGKAVVGVLSHPVETRNRAVYVQSAAVSQTQLLDIAKKIKPDLELKTERVGTEEVLQQSYALLQKGGENIKPAMINFIKISIFNDAYGSNWSEANDNALLGIREKSETELEEMIKQFV